MPSVTYKHREERGFACPGCGRVITCELLTPQTKPLVRVCPHCHSRVSIVAEGTIFGLWEVRASAAGYESRGDEGES
jgi:Zn finger protein HypA/HybF involved in hydrogenase expression